MFAIVSGGGFGLDTSLKVDVERLKSVDVFLCEGPPCVGVVKKFR